MQTSDVRKRVRETIERARRRAADRRARGDEASHDFDAFLERVAVPLVRQIANVLKADGYHFTVFTPSGSVRLMSDRRAEDYIELTFDASGDTGRVVGRSSHLRGKNVIESEQPVGSGKPASITEEELLDFLMKELEPLVER
ncbi:MAG: hypothetical protein DMG04_01800 [Acidobacteria bacterium]|nr:MAG: hypothetical protein DMG04_01800 [Acidobacteriota bacterium]PYQ83000.1 MAG: hypothetical protein DMG03_15535 [Acidobacteriota bacterium]PYQ85812.1 MAG: hypothetical protein DMG02_26390 [Acidobacteriota bacterium]PYR05283.1 MAG: hypothetical protein DMF99_28890 [Acidobacteriota bacterium]